MIRKAQAVAAVESAERYYLAQYNKAQSESAQLALALVLNSITMIKLDIISLPEEPPRASGTE